MSDHTNLGRERGRILDGLFDVTGLGDHIDHYMVDGRAQRSCHVHVDGEAHVGPLVIAHGLLDRPWTTTSSPVDAEDTGSVYVGGTYQGVRCVFAVGGLVDEAAVDAALADLRAAIEATGGAR